MKQVTERDFMDWHIRTVVDFDNPDDWKPGDPDRYVVRGVAEVRADGDRFSYSSNEPLTYTTGHFYEERRAAVYHAEASVDLQQRISRMKI